ncbi:hypothetical protein EMIT07CA2_50093 [Brevibacillus sp. IT-7CA2]
MYAFLDQYKKVIVKPATGSGGAGVMLVTRKAKSRYRVQRGPSQHTLRDKLETFRYLRRKITTPYLIQRGITLVFRENKVLD